jgi:hypothetical protein
VTAYFLRAIETVRRNKEQYAAAEARARTRHPVRAPYFDDFSAGMAMAEVSESLGTRMFFKSHIAGVVAEDM